MGDSQEDGPGDGAEGKMGLWGLFAVAFFWVSGGIYGNEPLANTGAPRLSLETSRTQEHAGVLVFFYAPRARVVLASSCSARRYATHTCPNE